MGERREVAGRADRAVQRDAGQHVGVGEREQRLDHYPAHAGMAACERGGLEHEDETHDGVVDGRTGARGMRQQERSLQLGKPGVVDARAREQPEAGIDAVDGAMVGHDARDGRGGGVDARFRAGVDRDALRRGPEPAQRRE